MNLFRSFALLFLTAPLWAATVVPSANLAGRIKPNGGSPPAKLLQTGDFQTLVFSCPFSQTAAKRCFWDIPVQMDLRGAAGLRLTLTCPNTAPVSQFNLYIRANGIWHAASFTPKHPRSWEAIEIPLSATRPEGISKGWGKVDMLRLAAWRGGAGNTSIALASIAQMPGSSTVAVLRSAATATKGERGFALSCAAKVAAGLRSGGIKPALLEDADIQLQQIRKYQIIFVAYSPGMPASLSTTLQSYVKRGGRLITFYTIPPALATALGFKATAYIPSSQLPGGLAGIHFHEKILAGVPATYRQTTTNLAGAKAVPGSSQVAGNWLDHKNRITPYAGLLLSPQGAWMTHVYLNKDGDAGARLLLALVAKFAPEQRRQSALHSLREITESIPGSKGIQETVAKLRQSANNATTKRALDQAVSYYNEGVRNFKAGAYEKAHEFALKGKRKFEEVSLLRAAVFSKAPEGEIRAVWCHRAHGVDGWSWKETSQKIGESGFNTLLVNVSSAGWTAYPSAYLPRTREAATRDLLAECLRENRARGIAVHAWKLCLNLGNNPSKSFKQRLEKMGRLQKTRAGTTLPWLCPTQAANIALEEATVKELVSKYPVAGLHLDFIRYPGEDCCFCPHCRRAFVRQLGKTPANFNSDTARGGIYYRQWIAFRQQQITRLLQRLATAARTARPSIQVSAAVFGNWGTARETVGQDWVSWCHAGYLDFVCPMDYFSDTATFQATVARQNRYLQNGKTKLLPGIGLSGQSLPITSLGQQIGITRRQRTAGFCIFEFNRNEATNIFPRAKKIILPK